MTEESNLRSEARPVVVVSNRLPLTLYRGQSGLEYRRSTGGLISALEPMLKSRGGSWVGWPGLDVHPGEELPSAGEAYEVHHVALSEGEIGRYYHGFSNRTLWPLFHSLCDRTRYDRRNWEVYERVNARFAEVAAKAMENPSLIWVHDYHLMCTPLYLRERLPEQRLAFFLHIPFPPYDVFRLLPWDRDILRSLLACDLVGFHVKIYARNFLDCVERLLDLPVDRERMIVECRDRVVGVGAFPIGIDFELVESRALGATPARVAHWERIVLGADRLDYTKGIPERIRAFERLLERHTEHRERTVLLQLAVPSRAQVAEYRELKRQIEELVGRVNGRFSTARWSPIRYLYREVPPDRLAALYRDAEVALVTPLRDGMNLVAKEFVASQVGPPGVLVLSRFAGSAEGMPEAVLVNPYDIDATAAAIQLALTMPEEERRSRLDALRERERRFNVHEWAASFLRAALASPAGPHRPSPAQFEEWLCSFLGDCHLSLFLDYDGTLSPLCAHPDQAVLSAPMRSALEACADRSDSDVTIVSGRSLPDITAVVAIPGLTYAGNHGLEIRGPGLADFRHRDLGHYQASMDRLAVALGEVASEGAWVEAKGPTLTFHYRAVPIARQTHLAAVARSVIRAAGFQARDAHAAVEARPPTGWDKGQAVLHVVRQRHGPTWSEGVRVIYVGDDQTDEDAFRALDGLGVTFRVGYHAMQSSANHRLHDVTAVQALLEWIARRGQVAPH